MYNTIRTFRCHAAYQHKSYWENTSISAASSVVNDDDDDTCGRSVFYAVSVNYLYRDRVRERVSCRVMDKVRVMGRVRRPDSSGNLLIRRKIHYA